MTRRAFPDAAARLTAASDFSTNLVVEAGAGTGKTSLLVERALTAIGSGVATITRIAAITFTEKAAGEMRQRIATGLDELRALATGAAAGEPARSSPAARRKDAKGALVRESASEARRVFEHLTGTARIAPEAIAARALRALEALDLARIHTIHGFCTELLREHPVESGVDPDFAVDPGAHAGALHDEWWEEFLARELGPAAAHAALWARVLSRFTLDAAGELARELASFRVPPEALASRDAASAGDALLETLASGLHAEIRDMLERASGLSPKPSEFLAAASEALRVLREEGLEAYQRFYAGQPALADRTGAPAANTRLQGVSAEEMDDLLKRTFRIARDLSTADDAAIADLLDALAPYAAEFRGRYLRQGLVDFDGILVLARDLLRDHPAVRDRLKRRYRVLFVDEFQDTDPLQYEIVLFLAERAGEAAPLPHEARLEPGKLFIVGDAKQSIYRFRGADFEAYRLAVDSIVRQGGRVLDLVANFRSVPGIVEPVNGLFAPGGASCWTPSAVQPRYVPIARTRDAAGARPAVEVWTLETGGDGGAEMRRRAEGLVLAEAIERLVAAGDASYEEISILFRSFGSIALYLRALRERGIPFVVTGGREFLKRPEVTQLAATLRALAQPADEVALLAFLRSPAGGVPDAELAAFAEAGLRWDWRLPVSAARCPTIADCFARLRRLDEETRHLPVETVVRRVVQRMQFLPLGAAAFEGAQRVANLRKLATAAGELARDGRLSLEEVVEALREGRLEDIEGDSPLADDRTRAVRISSIHAMKGLENRWVFVADLARGRGAPRGPSVSVATLRDPQGRTRLAVRAADASSSANVWADEQDRMHEAAEEVRVLYVALTRAKDHLVLLAGTAQDRSDWLDALRPWGFDADNRAADGTALAGGSVLSRIVAVPARTGSATAEEPAGAEDAVRRYEEAVGRMRAASTPPFRSPSALAEERDLEARAAREPAASESERDLARAAGSLVHRVLESWDGGADRALRDRLPTLARAAAMEFDVDEESLSREAAALVDRFLESDLARHYRAVERLGTELPMLARAESGAVDRGRIDLLYRDASGQVVVADFKTDRNTDADALRRLYGPQLAVYAKAVRLALGLDSPPHRELWILRSGERVSL